MKKINLSSFFGPPQGEEAEECEPSASRGLLKKEMEVMEIHQQQQHGYLHSKKRLQNTIQKKAISQRSASRGSIKRNRSSRSGDRELLNKGAIEEVGLEKRCFIQEYSQFQRRTEKQDQF
ncbi:hypothetical protein AYI70_g9100 [Smittium culicis]|uniref:Uncharacterized protein n=1 Tax=Smittium culicis TaxID=133412 RepID=A0A1R1XCX6_9FUNG|nr:hypothetical protein AYI70_g9100 [Smittium culicis]